MNTKLLVKYDKRRTKGAVACGCCGWQGYEKDLIADENGYEHCPACRQEDSFQIYDDDTREDLL